VAKDKHHRRGNVHGTNKEKAVKNHKERERGFKRD